ncbi:GerAB/ArcD/ProY family transporter [Bacillus cereus]|uniref:GerAB/ArcD/ProY family transporter n=1 Tax=Bacillus cereus TaxID=1396 RepID=UPI0018F66555|nr:GerAB/ArcD/ProY family transporter [Bacillus cereus]MBJ8025981.1 GerAB/ArcD/ProY family transporter [Bacillus cereus]MBJ8038267.1 GerAB/ArcD/ProY family transporter [Bacillus cereus]
MNEKKISQKQLFFLIFQSQVGSGVLSLPFSVHKHTQSDGWISILIAGMGIQLFLLLIWTLLWGFKGKNFYEITPIVFGKHLGKIINITYITYFVLIMSVLALRFANLLKKWILDYTPFSILVLLLLVTGIYIGQNNLRVLARFYTITTGLVILSMTLPWFSFLTNFQFSYLFPIGQSGLRNMVIGAHDATMAMIGFELMLVITPYIEGTYKQSFKSISLANMLVTLLYVYFTVSCYLIFSPEEIRILPEPVLYMLKAVHFQWTERLDLIFLSIWIVPISTSFVTYLYLSSTGVASMFHKGDRKYPVWYLALIVFLISLFFFSEFKIEQFETYIFWGEYAFILLIPFLTLLLSIVRKKFNYRSSGL